MEATNIFDQARSMPLGALCAEAGVYCSAPWASVPVTGITADSRRVRAGWLFVAIQGLHRNGADYVREAVERGASAVVCPPAAGMEEIPIPHIVTDNGREVMARLFDAWYGHPGRRLRLVGVTGTNGKTSVSSMLRHVLVSAGIPCGLIGTLGCISPQGHPLHIRSPYEEANMTTPDPEELYPILYRMAEEGKGGDLPTVVMEVTSHALALDKVAPLTYALSVFTNLTPEHLDMHGDMEGYFAAKARLFAQSRVGLVNGDDHYGRRLLTMDTRVGQWLICRTALRDTGGDVPCRGYCTRAYARQVETHGMDGVSYRLTTPRARMRLHCPVPGGYSVENSMQAAVAAMELGVTPTAVRTGLATFPGVQGRMERVMPPTDVPFSVFIDFAHTPDALERLLNTVRRLMRRGERLVLVFGCGGDRDPSKRRPMGMIASHLADMTVVTSDNSRTEDPRQILAHITSGMDPHSTYTVIPHRAEAIDHVIRHARPGDIILLVGKGHETYELDDQGKHPFSERALVCDAIRRYYGEG